MDKDKVMPVVLSKHPSGLARLIVQRDADFVVLEQVATALQLMPRWRAGAYGVGVFCTGCLISRLAAHMPNCPWLKLEALGIVEKA